MEKQLNVLLWNWGSGNYKKWMETEMQPMLEKWRAVILRWCLYYHLNSHSSFSINYHAGILNHRHIRMFNIYIYCCPEFKKRIIFLECYEKWKLFFLNLWFLVNYYAASWAPRTAFIAWKRKKRHFIKIILICKINSMFVGSDFMP